MGNERLRFLILLSVEDELVQEVGEYIAGRLVPQFGGLTILGGTDQTMLTGYWAADGQAFKKVYSGSIHKESVLGVVLSVLPKYEDRAYKRIQQAIVDAVSEFNLESRYVHVETCRTRAMHFDIHQFL